MDQKTSRAGLANSSRQATTGQRQPAVHRQDSKKGMEKRPAFGDITNVNAGLSSHQQGGKAPKKEGEFRQPTKKRKRVVTVAPATRRRSSDRLKAKQEGRKANEEVQSSQENFVSANSSLSSSQGSSSSQSVASSQPDPSQPDDSALASDGSVKDSPVQPAKVQKTQKDEMDSGHVSINAPAQEEELECHEDVVVIPSSDEEEDDDVEQEDEEEEEVANLPQIRKKVEAVRNTAAESGPAAEHAAWAALPILEQYPEFTPAPAHVDDPDKDNLGDPAQCSLYCRDIFVYYRYSERQYRVREYLYRHGRLTEKIRMLLVDWMVEVQESLELNHETLYTAVRLVDLHLARLNNFPRTKLQLLGATALYVASKLDERVSPELEDYVYICDEAYTKQQLIDMEIELVTAQDWNLTVPTSYRMLRRYAKLGRDSMETLTRARYVLELSLMEYNMNVSHEDSHVAAAALYLVHKISGAQDPWSSSLEWHTGYTAAQLVPVARKLNRMLRQRQNDGDEHLQTINLKYSHDVFFKATSMKPLANF